MLIQTHEHEVEGKIIAVQHHILNGLFRGSYLNWRALTNEHVLYMSIKKLTYYFEDLDISLKNDHLPLHMFLEQNTVNTKVDDWAVGVSI